MRQWYNGYRFSERKTQVYNPFSVLNFLNSPKMKICNYWYNSAAPDFLFEYVKSQAQPIGDISGIKVSRNFFGSSHIEQINLSNLMWETGYLTIHSYDAEKDSFLLDYPNQEVREAFLYGLLEVVAGAQGYQILETVSYAQSCKTLLKSRDLEGFFEPLKSFFSSIPYDRKITEEKYFQTVFYVMARFIGLQAPPEEKTSFGRAGMVVPTEKTIYVSEFKIDQTADSALQQIQDKRYYEPYLTDGKEIVLIGVSFSRKERNVSNWKHLSLGKQ